MAQQIYVQATLTKMCLRYHQGEADGEDARLGRGRVRRLHAKLKLKNTAACFSAGHRFSIAILIGAIGRLIRGGLPTGEPGKAVFGDETRQGTGTMADVAFQTKGAVTAPTARKKSSSLRNTMKRKSTVAFLMTLPLILLIAVMVDLSRLLRTASGDL